MQHICYSLLSLFLFTVATSAADYSKEVAPILKKYCVSCHNPEDKDGELSLESFADLLRGGEYGPVIMPGDSKNSRLIRVLTGLSTPKMPPRRSPPPKPEDIQLLAEWVDAGANGPQGAEPLQTTLTTPEIPAPEGLNKAVTALSWSPDGKQLAVARFKAVELMDVETQKVVRTLTEHPGKVNAVEHSSDGNTIITASGITGLYGQATLWNVETGKIIRTIRGHRDVLYAATLNSDATMVATAGYDQQIILWDASTGKEIRSLKGHNGAIYDLAFSPDGTTLASAGADDTVKVWQVSTGMRLDTLSQPLKEQYAVTFSPDGKYILAGGVDNRIRVWRWVSKNKQKINPMLYARFAHEASVLQIAFAPDGKTMITVGEDRTVKLWETKTFTSVHAYEAQPDVAPALAMAPDGERFALGRMDGSLKIYPVKDLAAIRDEPTVRGARPVLVEPTEIQAVKEVEPNDTPTQAMPLNGPSDVSGVIRAKTPHDADLFRLRVGKGERWVMEVRAERDKSPLDSKIEVLDAEGKPVLRKLLRAVRDSYITFRGIDSNTRDCRVHNWEEMDLNQFLYMNGEVVKLHTAPRGPDSGFFFYPDEGSRRCYFDTTANSHTLHEPVYVVEPHPPGAKLVPNGLPVFPLHFENDDDGRRELGRDSRLHFTAPEDSDYLIRVTDVRGFQGEKYKYRLIVCPAQPDFKVSLRGANPTINPGSGKEFSVKAVRLDGYEGPITVEISNLPPGVSATSPLVIQAGHDVAFGSIHVNADAPSPTEENAQAIKVTATAKLGEKPVTRPVNNFGTIKVGKKPPLTVTLEGTGDYVVNQGDPAKNIPEEWVIEPGQTIAATVRIQRNGFKGRVQFEALKQNLPHGVIVDNIGLNGLLIVEGQNERTFHLTAEDWVPETTRPFHLNTDAGGKQASKPILLRVRRRVAVPSR